MISKLIVENVLFGENTTKVVLRLEIPQLVPTLQKEIKTKRLKIKEIINIF